GPRIPGGAARPSFRARAAGGVATPAGLLGVPPGRELAFLPRLPVVGLWGVGPIPADKLRARGIRTVGEVAQLAEPVLVALLGRASGRHLPALAHNRDPRPVQVGRRRGSIGSPPARGRGAKRGARSDADLSP